MAERNSAVILPNLGLYLDRPAITVPQRGLQDGLNFRIREGHLTNLGLGWDRFSSFTLNGPVRLIDQFFVGGLVERVIFGTLTDLYHYRQNEDDVVFITPRYEEGTIDVSAADPAVVTFSEADAHDQVKAGDELHIGATGQRDPAATWFEVASVDHDNNTATLTTAVPGTPLNTQAFTLRQKFTTEERDWWSSEVFTRPQGLEDLWFATNGRQYVVTWDGNADQVTAHPELGIKARVLRVYSNMMVYGNLDASDGSYLPGAIVNSDVGNPLAAGDTGTGLSEQFNVHGGQDPIHAMEELADNLVVYTRDRIVQAQFVGDDLVFVFRTATRRTGLIAPHAVADYGNHHEFLSNDSMYRFDGVTSDPVHGHVWEPVLRRQDPVRNIHAYAVFDDEAGEVVWSLPLLTDPNAEEDPFAPPAEAFVSHYLEATDERVPMPHSRRQFPFTAVGYYENEPGLTWDTVMGEWQEQEFRWNEKFNFVAFPDLLAGDEQGRVWLLNTVITADGAPMSSFVRFGRKALGDGRMRGLLRRVYPFTPVLAANLTVTSRFADFASGDIDRTSVETFDMNHPEGLHFVSVFRRGRFVELEFGSAGDHWQLDGFDTDASPGGRR